MACIQKDQLHSVLSSTQTSITGKNLRSWLNEAGWPRMSWLVSLKEFICFISKFSTYFTVSDYIKFFDLFAGLASFMKVSWLSKHIDSSPWNWSSQEAGQVFLLCPSFMLPKCSISKVYWPGKWADPICGQACPI